MSRLLEVLKVRIRRKRQLPDNLNTVVGLVGLTIQTIGVLLLHILLTTALVFGAYAIISITILSPFWLTVVNSLDIDGEEPVPVFFLQHTHKTVVADAGVADQDIHLGNGGESGLYGGAVRNITLYGGCTGFLCKGLCGSGVLFIEDVNPVPPGGE